MKQFCLHFKSSFLFTKFRGKSKFFFINTWKNLDFLSCLFTFWNQPFVYITKQLFVYKKVAVCLQKVAVCLQSCRSHYFFVTCFHRITGPGISNWGNWGTSIPSWGNSWQNWGILFYTTFLQTVWNTTPARENAFFSSFFSEGLSGWKSEF